MSRRSRRSSTVASSMATSVALQQDRDAGAVRRLMTGKIRLRDADGKDPAGGVPFTCYRCGQPLTGSLDDASHHCLSNIKQKKDKLIANCHGRRGQNSLAQNPPAPTLLAKPGVAGYCATQAFTATPSGMSRENRGDAPRDPGSAEQVRAYLVKRGLPSSTDTSRSKCRRLGIADTSILTERETKIEEKAKVHTNAHLGGARDTCKLLVSHDVKSAQSAHVHIDLDLKPMQQPAPPPQAVGTASPPPTSSTSAAEEQHDTTCEEDLLATKELPARQDEVDLANDHMSNVANSSRRRSKRVSTQAASKAAASLAYQERHKARIARELQRCFVQTTESTRGTTPVGTTNFECGQRKQHGTDEQYEVEIVKAFRRNSCGDLEYLVIWKGFPASDATWEPAANLANLEPEMFAATPASPAESNEAQERPPVRGTGEMSSACHRCRCLGCGLRRLTRETQQQSLPQQKKRGTYSCSSDVEGVTSGYSGSGSWPVEILGPKPAPPYFGSVAVAASSAVTSKAALAVQSRCKQPQSLIPEVSAKASFNVPTECVVESDSSDATRSMSCQSFPSTVLPGAVIQSLRGLGPCEHLEKGKLPAGWYDHSLQFRFSSCRKHVRICRALCVFHCNRLVTVAMIVLLRGDRIRRDPLLASLDRTLSAGSPDGSQMLEGVTSQLRRFL